MTNAGRAQDDLLATGTLLWLYRGRGETFAIDEACPEDPCPEKLLTEMRPGTHTVVIGDLMLRVGTAIGIEKKKCTRTTSHETASTHAYGAAS